MRQLTERLLNGLTRAIASMFSDKELRDYEKLIIGSWRETLSAADRVILDRQLQAVEIVQRQAGDAKVCFYYGAGTNLPSFSNLQPNLHVATVMLRSKSAVEPRLQYIRAKLFLHRGRFFSIEFPKRIERYEQLHKIDMHELYVETVEPAS